MGEEYFRRNNTSEGSAAGVTAQALCVQGIVQKVNKGRWVFVNVEMKVETQAMTGWQKDIHNFLNIATTF